MFGANAFGIPAFAQGYLVVTVVPSTVDPDLVEVTVTFYRTAEAATTYARTVTTAGYFARVIEVDTNFVRTPEAIATFVREVEPSVER